MSIDNFNHLPLAHFVAGFLGGVFFTMLVHFAWDFLSHVARKAVRQMALTPGGADTV